VAAGDVEVKAAGLVTDAGRALPLYPAAHNNGIDLQ
jgi:hypothetical protein